MARRLTKRERADLISEADFDAMRPSNMREHHEVVNAPLQRVWTILDDGGVTDVLYASPGFHIVNKIGYVITEIPWTDDCKDAIYHDPD